MNSRIVKLLLPVAFAATGVGTFAIASPAQAAMPTCNTTLQYPKPDNTYASYPIHSTSGFSCLLGNGNAGSAVRALQKGLKKCYSSGLVVDGIFGNRTETVLKSAQRSAGVTADGVYGPQTANAIKFPWLNQDTEAYVRCARL